MIKVLKSIYSILYANVAVKALVSNKIYPNVVPDKTTANSDVDYPLIVMRRAGLGVEYSKGCSSDTATIELTCYATTYTKAVDIADAVRTALEGYKGTSEGIVITTARLDRVTEDYVENVYYQLLVFSIK